MLRHFAGWIFAIYSLVKSSNYFSII
jgi:hypothetical protein